MFLASTLALAMKNATYCSGTPSHLEEVRALTFLRDVVGIDVEAYDTPSFQLVNNKEHIPGHTETMLELVLTSRRDSEIQVSMVFVDGMLTWCTLNTLKGASIIKTEYAKNSLKAVRDLLERYQTNFNVSYCSKLTSLLDKLDVIDQDRRLTSSDADLSVTVREDHVNFRWNCKIDGIEIPKKTVGLTFEKGFFRGFVDTWGVTKIGSTTINVSEEEARKIALDAAKDYINDLGATVIEIEARLDIYNDMGSGRGDYYTLYPRWSVMLYFDRTYGNINGYYVAIWTDTGKIFHTDPQGYFGSTSQGPDLRTWVTIMIMLPAAFAIAIILYKKRSSTRLKSYRQRRAARL